MNIIQMIEDYFTKKEVRLLVTNHTNETIPSNVTHLEWSVNTRPYNLPKGLLYYSTINDDLPELPKGIKEVIAPNVKQVRLRIPDSVDKLFINSAEIVVNLPSSLTVLHAQKLKELPYRLPKNLKFLNADSAVISNLDLPINIITIHCKDINLGKIDLKKYKYLKRVKTKDNTLIRNKFNQNTFELI